MTRTSIAFLAFTLNHTGGTLNVIEYAKGLKRFYDIDSHFIINDPSTSNHDPNAYTLIAEQFPISHFQDYDLIKVLNELYSQGKIYAFYHVTQGNNKIDKMLLDSGLPMLVHMTGVGRDPWGLVYAYVSEWMSEFCSKGEFPYVPHIVQLPASDGNLRDILNIPAESVVIGRLGGEYSWNIHFVNNVINESVDLRSDIYFLLVNVPFFPQYFTHPRIKVFSKFPYDQELKKKFINTCDAMIHARAEGESFGFAPAEFSLSNRPIITYLHSTERAHISVLGKRGIYYESPDTLRSILLCIGKGQQVNWNCYENFDSENITRQFYDVFLGEKYRSQ